MVSEAAEIGPNGGGGEEGRVRTRREETGEKVQEGKGRRFRPRFGRASRAVLGEPSQTFVL